MFGHWGLWRQDQKIGGQRKRSGWIELLAAVGGGDVPKAREGRNSSEEMVIED